MLGIKIGYKRRLIVHLQYPDRTLKISNQTLRAIKKIKERRIQI
jgi:hypothetical protein